jgi:predicted PurR-regulated permease PerM
MVTPNVAHAGNPSTPPRSNVPVSLLAFIAAAMFLRYAQELFIPVVVSLLTAYALNPFVFALQRFKIPRTVAAVLVVATLFSGTAIASYAFRQQVTGVLDSLPDAAVRLRTQLQGLRQIASDSTTPIGKIQRTANEIEKTAAVATGMPSPVTADASPTQPPFRVADFVTVGSSMGLLAFISDAVLVMFLVLFFLISGDLFKRKLVHLIGTRLSDKKLTLETLNEISAQIERFLLIQVLTSICIAVCMSVALRMFGLRQPIFWGVVSGIACLVPYLGPICVGVASMLAAFVQFESLAAAIKIGLIPIILFGMEGLLVKPAVMGKAARINGVAMFLGLLFWAWIWGLIGIIVAVPIMMVIKTVCDRVDGLRPIGTLLDES